MLLLILLLSLLDLLHVLSCQFLRRWRRLWHRQWIRRHIWCQILITDLSSSPIHSINCLTRRLSQLLASHWTIETLELQEHILRCTRWVKPLIIDILRWDWGCWVLSYLLLFQIRFDLVCFQRFTQWWLTFVARQDALDIHLYWFVRFKSLCEYVD